MTPAAVRSLPETCIPVNRFPFRIGRKSSRPDPLSANELALIDVEPYQISLNHCAIIRLGERYFLIDRGSRRGTVVNGIEIGGRHRPGCLELTDWTNEVALGDGGTPYRFRVTIVPPEMTRP
jgi:pSer/pThr/pTyr-binding forkhead associated (FHA) protein